MQQQMATAHPIGVWDDQLPLAPKDGPWRQPTSQCLELLHGAQRSFRHEHSTLNRSRSPFFAAQK
eukprot:4017751-Prymnesium_polylepis.2